MFYMNYGYQPFEIGGSGLTRWVRALLALNGVVFILQMMIDPFTQGQLSRLLGLSVAGLMRGYFWQVVTYFFAHGSVMHLLLNMLVLYFMGPDVERALGSKSFLRLYFLAGILGGLAWLAFIYPSEGFCVGASGAVFGLLAAFATLFPNRPLTLLIFFIFPVTMKAWVLAVGLGFIQFLYLMNPSSGGIAYMAHLAGGLVGFIYVWLTIKKDIVGAWKHRADMRRYQQSREDSAEIDRILDKIASDGIHSISSRERAILDKASNKLRKS